MAGGFSSFPQNQSPQNPFPQNDSIHAQFMQRERAWLRVYIGAAPGVGKTWQMLHDANLLREQGVEAVIGTRRGGAKIEKAQPLYRRLGSTGFLYFMQTVVGLPGINDTQCGFKFFQRNAAKELFRRQQVDAYMFDVEILAIARRLGYRIQQVPVRWRDDADSRLDLVAGNLKNVRDIFKIGMRHRFGGRLK